MTSRRFAAMDLAEGYAYTDAALLIPMPELSDNSGAILQPFNLAVNDLTRFNQTSFLGN
jgi:hypothetical protein